MVRPISVVFSFVFTNGIVDTILSYGLGMINYRQNVATKVVGMNSRSNARG